MKKRSVVKGILVSLWLSFTLMAPDLGQGTLTAIAGQAANELFLPVVMREFVPSPGNLTNGDFELGPYGWTSFSSQGWTIITQNFSPGVSARSGKWAAWLGGDYNDLSYIEQQAKISNSGSYLIYYLWIASEEDDCNDDRASITINGVEVDHYGLCVSANSAGWVVHSINLTAYAGQQVMLRLQVQTNGSLNSNLFIDDLALMPSWP